jgi:hypothetical protein
MRQTRAGHGYRKLLEVRFEGDEAEEPQRVSTRAAAGGGSTNGDFSSLQSVRNARRAAMRFCLASAVFPPG